MQLFTRVWVWSSHILLTSSLSSYQNQREVAEGIKRAYKDVPGLKREDLFIVSETISKTLRALGN